MEERADARSLRAGCHSLRSDGRPAEALQRPPVEDATMAKADGIDLGTTNPMIAAVEGGQPTMIANGEGSWTASVVAVTELREWVDDALRGDT
jgi:hypothetical protein